MTVINVQTDVEELTLTLVAEFDASPERLWQIWADARQLERWWGPPSWPASFERHEFVAGGQSRYHMTGPEGQKARGWWRLTAIDPPHRLELDDGFADDAGEPLDPADAVHMVVTIEAAGDRTRMTTVTRFTDATQLQRMLDMGMEQGIREAAGQIDELLAEPAS